METEGEEVGGWSAADGRKDRRMEWTRRKARDTTDTKDTKHVREWDRT